MTDTPNVNSYQDYIRLRRIERAVEAVCRERGINGDPLADVPKVGTLRQQLTLVGLYHHLPRSVRRHPACDALMRAAVLSHRDEHPRIARERRTVRR